MNFDKLMKYQKLDQENMTMIREFKATEECKIYFKWTLKVKEAQEQMKQLNSVASEIMAEYNKLVEETNNFKVELKEFEGIAEGAKEVDELNYYIKSIEQLMDGINQLEKKSTTLKKKIEETNILYKKVWNQGIEADKKKREASPAYKQKLAELKPIEDAKQAEIDALEKELPEKMVEYYKTLKQANKLPAFVEYDPQSNQCGRCFMELANDTRSKLKNPGDYVECPNCRRILFIPEEK